MSAKFCDRVFVREWHQEIDGQVELIGKEFDKPLMLKKGAYWFKFSNDSLEVYFFKSKKLLAKRKFVVDED